MFRGLWFEVVALPRDPAEPRARKYACGPEESDYRWVVRNDPVLWTIRGRGSFDSVDRGKSSRLQVTPAQLSIEPLGPHKPEINKWHQLICSDWNSRHIYLIIVNEAMSPEIYRQKNIKYKKKIIHLNQIYNLNNSKTRDILALDKQETLQDNDL